MNNRMNIPNYSNYSCDTKGNVYKNDGSLLNTVLSGTGYLYVHLYDDSGKRRTVAVHRLMATTYLPNPENKKTVNHKDLDKKNNCLDNLEWLTTKENLKHARENKDFAYQRGEDNYHAKLTETLVKQIATLLKYTTRTAKEICSLDERIRPSDICNINTGLCWKWATADFFEEGQSRIRK